MAPGGDGPDGRGLSAALGAGQGPDRRDEEDLDRGRKQLPGRVRELPADPFRAQAVAEAAPADPPGRQPPALVPARGRMGGRLDSPAALSRGGPLGPREDLDA